MVGGGKFSSSPPSKLAADLKHLLPTVPASARRRTKTFAYGFLLAFLLCTAFLVLSPSSPSSLFSSPFISRLLPYSDSQIPVQDFRFGSPPKVVGSAGDGVELKDQSVEGNGSVRNGAGSAQVKNATAKNEMAKVVGSAGDGVELEDQSVEGNGSERNGAGGAPVKNATAKNEMTKVGSPKDGVVAKDGSERDTPVKNGTAKVVGDGVFGKNQAKHGNATAKVVGSVTDGVLGRNQTKQGKEAGATEVKNVAPVRNQTDPKAGSPQTVASKKNQTAPVAAEKHEGIVGGDQVLNMNSTSLPVRSQTDPKPGSPQTVASKKNQTAPAAAAEKHRAVVGGDQVLNMNSTSLPARANGGQGREVRIEELLKCDIFHGNWVKDDSYPLYPEGSCPHIDEPFDCYHNGRPDRGYQKLRWQPTGCNIPRLNGTDMLEKLRGKRLVFVGDSLNRNMWESLVCVLRNSVKDKKKVFEASGRRQFKTEGSYSFIFKDYGCTVEFFRSPFLVQEWEMPDHNGSKKETLRLDLVEKSASMYKSAYAIIFNTGHWWTHEKTSQGKDYYQEGNHVYSELNVGEAFHKALNTWAKWVDANVNPQKTHVFFRGYSASHFSGGQWNSGGQCHKETEPIKNEKYLSSYPPKMSILEEVIKGMKTHVSYMNITRMTDYRKDAHPSIYEKPNTTPEESASDKIQDCSHWCLPGVPDSWNELLYAQLLIKLHGGKH